MNYEISADVSINIDAEFMKEHPIHFIPMEYILGEETFHCTAPESDEAMHHYYERLRQKETTHTSQITPSHYVELFEPLVKEGKAILYLSLSSGLSDTYSSANVAVNQLKEDYDNVQIEVVDSLGATGGMGLLAEAAIENHNKGMSLEENASWLRENAVNIQYWFKVEDLMYLMRGGRVSATTAIFGTALNIKPILTIDSTGHLQTIDKKRGNKLAMKALLDHFKETYDETLGSTVYICCSDCLKEAGQLKEALLSENPNLTVRTTMLSPIIGAHTGPDMLALIHFGRGRNNEGQSQP